MSLPLTLALGWLVLANILALLPSRDRHRTRAVFLIVIGVPLLGWVTVRHGPLPGIILLAAGASLLRWPVIRLFRWVRAQVG